MCIGCFTCIFCAWFCVSECPSIDCFLSCDSADNADDFTSIDVVDLYNGVTGTWSTARLSVGRENFAAASVGEVALFAGGISAISAVLWDEEWWWRLTVTCESIIFMLIIAVLSGLLCPTTVRLLMRVCPCRS